MRHLQTINSCDSIVTMDLTINYSIQTTDSVVACDSYGMEMYIPPLVFM